MGGEPGGDAAAASDDGPGGGDARGAGAGAARPGDSGRSAAAGKPAVPGPGAHRAGADPHDLGYGPTPGRTDTARQADRRTERGHRRNRTGQPGEMTAEMWG